MVRHTIVDTTAYNSQSGNGLAGWGWNLSGLSMISRVPKTYFHDQEKSGITWDDDCAFALDGNRLFVDQQYGSDSIEYYTEKEMAARVVGYNIQEWGPEYFKVYYKNGQTATYGDNPTARYRLYDYYNSSSITLYRNLGWAITRQEDANGNYMEVVYTSEDDISDGTYNTPYGQITITSIKSHNHRPKTIKYGANTTASSGHFAEIEFVYETRSDTEEKYLVGQLVKQEYRLKDVLVKSNSVEVNRYELLYDFIETSKLASVLQHSNGKQKNAIAFDWAEHDYAVAKTQHYYVFPTTIKHQNKIDADYDYSTTRLPGDFDGDGKNDFIRNLGFYDEVNGLTDYTLWQLYLNNDSRNLIPVAEAFHDEELSHNGLLVLDKDGDGQDELYVRKLLTETHEYDCGGGEPIPDEEEMLRGQQQLPQPPDDPPGGGTCTYTTHDEQLQCFEMQNGVFSRNTNKDYKIRLEDKNHHKEITLLPGDFDGDGDPDIVAFRNGEFYNSVGIYTTVSTNNLGTGILGFELLDFNGDGKTDILIKKNSEIRVYTYNEPDRTFDLLCTSNSYNNMYDFKVGDFNGDGNSDLLVSRVRGSGNDYWKILTSNGKNMFVSDVISVPELLQLLEYYNYLTTSIADINNDGKSDVVQLRLLYPFETDYQLNIYISNGGSFTTKATHDDLSIVTNGFERNQIMSYCNYIGSEMNELLLASRDFYHYRYMAPYSVGNDSDYNKITGITNSLGNRLAIGYDYAGVNSLSNSRKVEDENGNSQLISEKNIKLKVVTEVTSQEEDKNYAYGSAIIHKLGRGFLGFDLFSVSDEKVNLATLSEFEVNTQYNIMNLKRSLSYKISDPLFVLKGTNVDAGSINSSDYINETEYNNVLEKAFYRLKGFYNYVDRATTKNYLTGTGKTQTFDYDDYMNPVSRTETAFGDHLEQDTVLTTETVFADYVDNGSWCLSKPQSKTITVTRGGEIFSRSVTYSYDAKGNLASETKDPGNENSIVTNYVTYDAFGHPTQVDVTANGITRSTTYEYTPSGRFLYKKTNAQLNETVTYGYDEDYSLLKSKTGPYGLTTTYQYGAFGRLRKTNYPDGLSSVTAHQWVNGNGPSGAKYYVYTETSGEPPVWTWYDILGRELQTESYGLDDSKKIWVDTEYDGSGRVYRKSEPYFSDDPGSLTWAATYGYDEYGRQNSLVTPMGETTTVYDSLKTVVTTPNSVTETTRNAAGETVSSKVNGKSVFYTYYASGLTKTATPEGGIALTMEYDLQGNRTKLVDPDAGTIRSKYNGFGELVWEKQKIHLNQDTITTAYVYKSSGLLDNINRNGEITTHAYDSRNRIGSIAIAGKHSQTFTYDTYNRVTAVTEDIEGENFTSATTYDDLGRVERETYPSGFYITNRYNKYGYLTEVRNQSGTSLWKAETANARGQLTQTRFGNNQLKTFGYSTKGQPTSIVAGNAIDQSYQFYDSGNLEYRTDNLTNQKEEFFYDSQNRLETWEIRKNSVIMANHSMGYDGLGNITQKSDIGFAMNYEHGSKPHVLTSIDGNPEGIDENQSITYTDFKKVATITQGDKGLSLVYGVDDQRRKAIYTLSGSTQLTRYYLGNYELDRDNAGNERKIHYISGGDGIAAIYVIDNSVATTYYVHTDYLGSLTSLTDANGSVIENYAYGPWGKRRNPADWTLADLRTAFLFDRGYTGHEHLDGFGLINMNGRVYDPLIAGFLSPDPYVQAPGNWLNYNRYGYAFNNPMLYTDPSGDFIFSAILPGIGTLIDAACWGAVIGGAGYTASVAFSNGGFSNWNGGAFWKSVGMGAISGVATAGIGQMFGPVGNMGIGGEIARAYTHGFAQGMVSEAFGGDFMAGFAAGGLGSLGGSAFSAFEGNLANSMLGQVGFSALSGGVGAELTGGDFWRGAATGATIGLLNHASAKLQEVNPERLQKRILKDGRLTLREANLWYQHGKGFPLTVDASKVDLDFINPYTWKNGQTKPVQTLFSSRDGKVYGNLTLEYKGNQQFKIHPDEYDFRMHSGKGFKVWLRNQFTKIGRFYAGDGNSYWINFNGLNKVNWVPFPY